MSNPTDIGAANAWHISTEQGSRTVHLAREVGNFDLYPLPEAPGGWGGWDRAATVSNMEADQERLRRVLEDDPLEKAHTSPIWRRVFFRFPAKSAEWLERGCRARLGQNHLLLQRPVKDVGHVEHHVCLI